MILETIKIDMDIEVETTNETTNADIEEMIEEALEGINVTAKIVDIKRNVDQ